MKGDDLENVCYLREDGTDPFFVGLPWVFLDGKIKGWEAEKNGGLTKVVVYFLYQSYTRYRLPSIIK